MTEDIDFSGQGGDGDGAELTDWYTRNKVIMLLAVLGNSYCRLRRIPDSPFLRRGFHPGGAQPARDCREDTGTPWLQPLGPAHALLETAHHARATAADPADRAAVADAVARTRLDTIAGSLDWTTGPAPDIALPPLTGGQWQPGPDGPRLTVVTNAGHPEVPLPGDLTPAR
ncbi:hypothetical protein [Streptomyces sp. NRRL S-1022]|uniref:hypothetical protein n=1 Tax=Streptomyces sp. NRRL S-1022 TaxID=1463880 RepID=UPI0018FE140C|nr:hypothetical protein [Streptomyces sp. NRRL S-1022]